MIVAINGKLFAFGKTHVDYKDIVNAKGLGLGVPDGTVLTVTYAARIGSNVTRQGSLFPGAEAVELVPFMRFTVADTSGA